jgi:hypothetical protein
MRKKSAVIAGCAVASSILALTAVSRGAVNFTENFSSGDVTDGGLWSTGVVTNPAHV